MLKKIIAGVCAAVTALSCAAFCAVDAARELDGPLFYHHYITYNVTEACRSFEEKPDIEPLDLYFADDPRYFPVAAAINTRHVLAIESAELDLGEYGVYPLRAIGTLYNLENDTADMRNREASQPPILDQRFKTGATGLTFEAEDLKALSERLDGAEPVTAEQLLIRYNYDGNECEKIIPFRITLFTGDSQVGRLTDTGNGPENVSGYKYAHKYTEDFWFYSLNPGCTITQTTLPYAQELQNVLTMSPEPERSYEYTPTLTPGSFFTTCHVAQAGLYCVQLHFQIEGVDAAGNQVSTFSTERVTYLSDMPQNAQNELQQREGGEING